MLIQLSENENLDAKYLLGMLYYDAQFLNDFPEIVMTFSIYLYYSLRMFFLVIFFLLWSLRFRFFVCVGEIETEFGEKPKNREERVYYPSKKFCKN